jgi:hypothetical protein
MRSLLAYSDEDGSAPSGGGVLLLQLGMISVVHRREEAFSCCSSE